MAQWAKWRYLGMWKSYSQTEDAQTEPLNSKFS